MTEWSRLKPTVGGTIRQIDIYGDKVRRSCEKFMNGAGDESMALADEGKMEESDELREQISKIEPIMREMRPYFEKLHRMDRW